MTNHSPTGFFVTLGGGIPFVGVERNARPNSIKDKDGIDRKTASFEWRLDGKPIPGVTGDKYTPVMADRGKHLTVVWRYIDLKGNHENVETKPLDSFVTEPQMENLRGLYKELFDREPDGPGLAFWADTLTDLYKDGMDRCEALIKIMELFIKYAEPDDKAAYQRLNSRMNK